MSFMLPAPVVPRRQSTHTLAVPWLSALSGSAGRYPKGWRWAVPPTQRSAMYALIMSALGPRYGESRSPPSRRGVQAGPLHSSSPAFRAGALGHRIAWRLSALALPAWISYMYWFDPGTDRDFDRPNEDRT